MKRAALITNHVAASVWAGVEEAPPDPILGLTARFKEDKDKNKMNLGVGAYRTEDGKPYVLNVVKKAESALLDQVASGAVNKEYLPIDGLASFKKATTELILGSGSKSIAEGRVACTQALSGTGALRIGGMFINNFLPGRMILLSNPTWGNHKAIFGKSGLKVGQYRYFHPATKGLDFDGMIEDLKAAPDGSVVLLHACAHNPTGVDPTVAQWNTILDVVKAKSFIPFFDCAYQGYASGDLARDAAAVQMFDAAGVELMIAQSYSKNFGLYGERIGALSLTCSTKEATKATLSQLKMIVRPMYSNPPKHGAHIVAHCLADKALYQEWAVELKGMADRIIDMRALLLNELKRLGTPGDWSHITSQIGMFSFTGIPKDKVQRLINEQHIYMTADGRISIAGINPGNVGYLAQSIHKVMTS
jgi:aspartate aminotransferase